MNIDDAMRQVSTGLAQAFGLEPVPPPVETLDQALARPWLPALTLTPPWSWLVWRRRKGNETRSWHQSNLVGCWLAIHSGSSLQPVGGLRRLAALCATEPFRSALGGSEIGLLPVGAVVALVRVQAMYPTAQGWDEEGRACAAYRETTGTGLERRERVVPVLGDEAAFGDYRPGRWVWVFDEVLPLHEPIKVGGHQRIWRWWLSDGERAQLRTAANDWANERIDRQFAQADIEYERWLAQFPNYEG